MILLTFLFFFSVVFVRLFVPSFLMLFILFSYVFLGFDFVGFGMVLVLVGSCAVGFPSVFV